MKVSLSCIQLGGEW